MPIYEYTCEACGKAFEHFARTLDDKPKTCPACGAENIKKGFSTFRAQSVGTDCNCAHAHSCSHAHGAGCGCGCC